MSFSEVTLVEAVARLVKVQIVPAPTAPGKESRLASRFLGQRGKGELLLAAPETRKGKVFLSTGCRIGLVFSVAEQTYQAQTAVADHCLFQPAPGRRVDAVVVWRPEKVTCLDQRSQPRWQADTNEPVFASLWPAEELGLAGVPAPRVGRLANWSAGGMGLVFDTPPALEDGADVVIRLEGRGLSEHPVYRAVLRHCTPRPEGGFLVGLADAEELGPGQAVWIMEARAALGRQD